MALEKITTRTVFQRFRGLILGKERPNIVKRVSLLFAFLIWIYLFSWQLITAVSILLLGGLEQSPTIKAAYNNIGTEIYGYTDSISLMFYHAIVQMFIYFIILVGMVLIYRGKKFGYLLYTLSFLTTILASFVMMGWKFLANEISILDYALVGSCVIYFGIGAFWFYKKSQPKLQPADH